MSLSKDPLLFCTRIFALSVFRSSEALQARKGVVKMLIVSVVVYFISYSPKQILLIYDTVHPSDFHENWTVHVFTMIVCYINSAANPVLYSIFSQNFRKNFKVVHCILFIFPKRPKRNGIKFDLASLRLEPPRKEEERTA
jgi:hypothetical protein